MHKTMVLQCAEPAEVVTESEMYNTGTWERTEIHVWAEMQSNVAAVLI